MAKHLLSDRQIRNAKAKAKPYRLFDGDGLALWVSSTGAKSWQLRYRLNGKEQTATIGKLSRLTLAEARVRADGLRKLATDGEHLTTFKRRERLQREAGAANTFKVVASAWAAREAKRQKWTPDYVDEVAAAYDRARRLALRRALMNWYEATLIAARDGARVVPLEKQGRAAR